ncbi:MAG: hypothetical protein HGA44_00060 [Cellulomonadaceae bacterium]|nr:hypothetical protein [Cellulomonadaceae bacterium]
MSVSAGGAAAQTERASSRSEDSPSSLGETTTTPEGTVVAPRRPRLRRLGPEVIGATASALISLTGLFIALRLWKAHFGVPLAPAGDIMLSLSVVKGMQENGWFQFNPSLGYPFGQDYTAYPAAVGDFWHMATLKALSLFLSPAATINVFFVMGFSAAAVFAFACARRLHVSIPVAIGIGAAYSWLPYHFLRSESHLMLSAYYAVPVACVIAYETYNGRINLTRRWRGSAWWTLLGTILLAGTGLYYAVFAVVIIAAAALLSAIARRSGRALISGFMTCGFILLGLALAAIPNLLHTPPEGSTPAVEGRSFGATEFYGLKITNLLLPWGLHRVPFLAGLRANTADSPIPGEGSEALGVLGVAGLIALVLAVLMPLSRARPQLAERLRPLGALAVISLIVATVSGLNSILAVLGYANMRAWNRMSVLIAFLSLAGLGLCIDALVAWARRRLHPGSHPVRRAIAVALAPVAATSVVVVAFLDQTSDSLIPDYAGTAAGWNADEAYFRGVESVIGSEAAVFTLPYAPFPENPPIVNMPDYSHLRGYIHSNLKWSYGGIKGELSSWQPVALEDGIAAALPRLVAAGFDAVYINRNGYEDHGAQLEADIVAVIGNEAPLVNSDGSLATYDLRSYADELRETEAVPDRDAVVFPTRLEFGLGTYGLEGSDGDTWHWANAVAHLTLVNPSTVDRKVAISGQIRIADPGAPVTVTVAGERTELVAEDGMVDIDIRTVAEPGITDIAISTESVATPGVAGDPRDLRQQLLNLRALPLG